MQLGQGDRPRQLKPKCTIFFKNASRTNMSAWMCTAYKPMRKIAFLRFINIKFNFFLGACQTLTGAQPLDPAGRLPSPNPPATKKPATPLAQLQKPTNDT